MKEENLSTIKRYPITAYLESKGITPVRRLANYVMYRSPLRDEHHPSFKVDTEKNLWINYAKGRGGSIILRAFLDNDDAGRRTLGTFVEAGFQVEDMSVHYQGCKDFNEFHASRICRLQEQAPITTKPSHRIKLKRR